MKTFIIHAHRARAHVWHFARPLVLLVVMCGMASGQSIVKPTPASAGSTMRWERGSLTMTIGQAAAGRIANGSVGIHSGFLPPPRTNAMTSGIGPELELRVYPQPSHGDLRIELPALPSLSMALYDISGRRCLSEHYAAGPVTIDLTSIPPGLYFLHVYRGSDVVQTKLITVIR